MISNVLIRTEIGTDAIVHRLTTMSDDLNLTTGNSIDVTYTTVMTTSRGDDGATTATAACPTTTPDFYMYMKEVELSYFIVFCVLACLDLLLVINYAEEIIYLFRTVDAPKLSRDRAKWILAIYPVLVSSYNIIYYFQLYCADINNLAFGHMTVLLFQ